MLWAAVALCFFGFLRAEEVIVPADGGYDPRAHLSFTDISVDSVKKPATLKVGIKSIEDGPVPDRPGHICQAYVLTSSSCAVLSRHQRFKCGPTLHLDRRSTPVNRVRQALSLSGVNCTHYSGHSFRSGRERDQGHDKSSGMLEE